jgi:hypothetical protein
MIAVAIKIKWMFDFLLRENLVGYFKVLGVLELILVMIHE